MLSTTNAGHPAEKASLLRALYRFGFHQPQQSLDREEREQQAARLRHLCSVHGVDPPDYLHGLHAGVEAHPTGGGSYRYTYANPWEGPEATLGPVARADYDASGDPDSALGDRDDPDDGAGTRAVAGHLAAWQRKLTKALQDGKDLSRVRFVTDQVSEPIQGYIRRSLPGITTAAALRELFRSAAADND